jgi:hypothetical protein
MGLPQQFVDRLPVDPRQYVGDRVNTSPQGPGYYRADEIGTHIARSFRAGLILLAQGNTFAVEPTKKYPLVFPPEPFSQQSSCTTNI